jgi:hypothetical protein
MGQAFSGAPVENELSVKKLPENESAGNKSAGNKSAEGVLGPPRINPNGAVSGGRSKKRRRKRRKSVRR